MRFLKVKTLMAGMLSLLLLLSATAVSAKCNRGLSGVLCGTDEVACRASDGSINCVDESKCNPDTQACISNPPSGGLTPAYIDVPETQNNGHLKINGLMEVFGNYLRVAKDLIVNGFTSLADLEVSGDLKLTKGAGAGKVLVSNADGLASWSTSTAGGVVSGLLGVLQQDPDASGYKGNVSIGSSANGANFYVAGGEIKSKWIHSTTAGNNTIAGNLKLGSNENPVWFQVATNNTIGANNIGIGIGALTANTVGKQSVAIGNSALKANTSGNYNNALGYGSLAANTVGSNNSALGSYSLYKNIDGQRNSAVGYASLSNNNASYNSAFGYASLYDNAVGANNSAFGYASLRYNKANNNSAFGSNSLYKNTDGQRNSAVGYASLYGNTTGGNNSAVGYVSLYKNSIGTNNSAVGYASLYNNDANNNSGFGFYSLYANTTGIQNTGIGSRALSANTVGNYNSAVGVYAMRYSTTGNGNTASGYSSLFNNTTGSYNSAVGYASLYKNSVGISNSALGYGSLYSSLGSYNTAVGRNSLYSLASGNKNVALGYYAGRTVTDGSRNIFIGANTDAGSTKTFNDSMVIGYNSKINVSNAAVIGNNATMNTTNALALAYPKVGINTTEPTTALDVNGSVKIGENLGVLGNIQLIGNLQTAGTIQFRNNGAGAGKVLTSDADGFATWQDPVAGNGGSEQDLLSVLQKGSDASGFDGGVKIGNTEINKDGGAIISKWLYASDENGLSTFAGQVYVNKKLVVGTDVNIASNLTAGYGEFGQGIGIASGKSISVNNTASTSLNIGNFDGQFDLNILGQTNIKPQNNKEGLVIISSNYSPLVIKNSLDKEFLRVKENGTVIFGDKNPVYFPIAAKASGGGTPFENLAIGKDSLINCEYNSESNPSAGAWNTAVGNYSLSSNTTGLENAALGYRSLQSNTTGGLNSAFGGHSLFSNTYGDGNSAFGHGSLFLNTTGESNSAFGWNAMVRNQTGSNNVAVGARSLETNNSGEDNVAVGASSLYAIIGNNNTAIGRSAGKSITSGSYNIFLGADSGRETSGQLNNVISIGNNNKIGTSDVAVIGNNVSISTPDSPGSLILAYPKVGINTTNPKVALEVNGEIKTTPVTEPTPTTCSKGQAGTIKYVNVSSARGHFFGCVQTSTSTYLWRQLDNN